MRSSNTFLDLLSPDMSDTALSDFSFSISFLQEPYTKRFRKTEKMSRTAYIASSGGLLGLCMGFSFVSLAEIAYHCFICCGLLFSSSSGSAAKSVKDFGDNEGSSGGSDGGGGGGDGDKRRRRSVADGCEVNGDGG